MNSISLYFFSYSFVIVDIFVCCDLHSMLVHSIFTEVFTKELNHFEWNCWHNLTTIENLFFFCDNVEILMSNHLNGWMILNDNSEELSWILNEIFEVNYVSEMRRNPLIFKLKKLLKKGVLIKIVKLWVLVGSFFLLDQALVFSAWRCAVLLRGGG